VLAAACEDEVGRMFGRGCTGQSGRSSIGSSSSHSSRGVEREAGEQGGGVVEDDLEGEGHAGEQMKGGAQNFVTGDETLEGGGQVGQVQGVGHAHDRMDTGVEGRRRWMQGDSRQ